MAKRTGKTTRPAPRGKPLPAGPVTSAELASAMPRILGPRAKGLPVPAAGIAALASRVEHARRAFEAAGAERRKRGSLRRAHSALAEAEAPAAALAEVAALLAAPRWGWAGQDLAALALAREFQSVVKFLIPDADLGMGGATARFVAWAMERITGKPTSADSVLRQAKRGAARHKAAQAEAEKSDTGQ